MRPSVREELVCIFSFSTFYRLLLLFMFMPAIVGFVTSYFCLCGVILILISGILTTYLLLNSVQLILTWLFCGGYEQRGGLLVDMDSPIIKDFQLQS